MQWARWKAVRVKAKPSTLDAAALAALALAWVGLWGAWVPHTTAGLTQNAFVLAYWSGVLPEVRWGRLGFMPDAVRLAIALAVVALALAAGAIRSPWLRWAVRLVALVPGLILLPPYPFVLDLWRSDVYGRRFVIAAAAWLGVAAAALVDRLPDAVRRALIIVLALAGAGLGIRAFAALRGPFAARYAAPIPPGWGFVLFAGGLLAAALLQGAGLLSARGQDEGKTHTLAAAKSENGPVA